MIDWRFGSREVRGNSDWRQVQSRFVIPPGAAAILPRLTGQRDASRLGRRPRAAQRGPGHICSTPPLPEAITTANAVLEVTFHPADGTIDLRDLRCGQVWSQRPAKRCYVLDAKATERGIEARLLEPASVAEMAVTLQLDGEKARGGGRAVGQGADVARSAIRIRSSVRPRVG